MHGIPSGSGIPGPVPESKMRAFRGRARHSRRDRGHGVVDADDHGERFESVDGGLSDERHRGAGACGGDGIRFNVDRMEKVAPFGAEWRASLRGNVPSMEAVGAAVDHRAAGL